MTATELEVFETAEYFILQDPERALWASKSNGHLSPRQPQHPSYYNAACIGMCYGVVGKLQLFVDSPPLLVVIKSQTLVATLPAGHKGHSVFCIKSVAVLPLSEARTGEVDLNLCASHQTGCPPERRVINPLPAYPDGVGTRAARLEKEERKLLDEVLSLFNENEFFYYSPTADLTGSVQRQWESRAWQSDSQVVDDRFFWNREMLTDLLNTPSPLSQPWLIPVIQGFVQSSPFIFPGSGVEMNLMLISRRSRHRAGTRYNRRGVDELGFCANSVETEQILHKSPHICSFVIKRASVPLFWSQSGMSYRPPVQLLKSPQENAEAFNLHFQRQLAIYRRVVAVSLLDCGGREGALHEAFLSSLLELDSADLAHITFDFHAYCKGTKFENVSLLVDSAADFTRDMHFFWLSAGRLMDEQRGVFRVNCMDCLDRTNVVQSALSKSILETQLSKLGLHTPSQPLPAELSRLFQLLWANNGDIISKQYAGTSALKGDFTRTGERSVAGLMKDGMNSANRYYLGQFHDATRQAAICVTLGEAQCPGGGPATAEAMLALLADCRLSLLPSHATALGAWPLIDSSDDTVQPDVVLLLTETSLFIVHYADDMEKITHYQELYMLCITAVEIGPEASTFRSNRWDCARLHYNIGADSYWHTFRTPHLRAFNNTVVPVKSRQEAQEALHAICEAVVATAYACGFELSLTFSAKIEKRKCPKAHPVIIVNNLNSEPPEESGRLLAKIASSVNPIGRLRRGGSSNKSTSDLSQQPAANTNYNWNGQSGSYGVGGYTGETPQFYITSDDSEPLDYMNHTQQLRARQTLTPELPRKRDPQLKPSRSAADLAMNGAADGAATAAGGVFGKLKDKMGNLAPFKNSASVERELSSRNAASERLAERIRMSRSRIVQV